MPLLTVQKVEIYMLKKVARSLVSYFKPISIVEHAETEEEVRPVIHRGLIEYNAEHCSFCDQCEKICPHSAIVFYQHADGSKEYAYNPFLCEYCGECVDVCPNPQEALWQCEIRPVSSMDEADVMIAWSVWQDESEKSRLAYAANKVNARESAS